ncbi:trithorax group protein osa-like isoform X2 [Acanthaster planci]|uniref:Trithorax group protein osa-like isoform X2 n=1 Tax=Acanthaster planci TaxID=133434 RepID=A0A8B7YZQ5_ACAPL|nr:trithorax group protein osa-like isoform X2 [Acanthaster planci]
MHAVICERRMIKKSEPDGESGEKEEEGGGGEKTKKRSETPTKAKVVKWQYDADALHKLRYSPGTKKRPLCLAEEYCDDNGIWDPEKWHAALSGKRSRGPSPLTLQEGGRDRKKFPGDVKDRLKDDKDGIILSPQRRSFGHGCSVTTPLNTSLPAHLGANFSERGEGKEAVARSVPARRIGSGRIITRNRSLDQEESETRERREAGRYEDRGNQRVYSRRGSYGNADRSWRTPKQEEPEWFTEGPESQSDTIVLRGFSSKLLEDSDSDAETKEAGGPSVQNRNGSMETASSSSPDLSRERPETMPDARPNTPGKEFDINDFFKFADQIPMPMVASPEETERSGKSRFSHLFTSTVSRSRSNSNSRSNSRKSSLHEDELDFLNELTGRSSPALMSPASVFTPIKPTGDHALHHPHHQRPHHQPEVSGQTQQSLLHLLQSGQALPMQQGHSAPPGPVKSLAEIEAGLKQASLTPKQDRGRSTPPAVPLARQAGPPISGAGGGGGGVGDLFAMMGGQNKEDRTAFNRLVSSMRASGNLPAAKMPPPVEGRSLSPIEVQLLRQRLTPSPQPPAQQLYGPGQPSPHHSIRSTRDPAVAAAAANMAAMMAESQHQQQQQHGMMMGNQGRRPPAQGVPPTLLVPDIVNRIPSPIDQEVMATLMAQGTPSSQDRQPHLLKPTPTNQQEVMNALLQQASANPTLAAALRTPAGVAPQAGISPVGRVPSPAIPQDLLHQALLQQQQHTPRTPSPIAFGQQSPLPGGRSPIPFGLPGATSPLLPNARSPVIPASPTTTPIRPRVPSPQELAKHTQNILQQALIKRQLELQKEKFIARESARSKSPVPSIQGPGTLAGQMPASSAGQTPSPSAMSPQVQTKSMPKINATAFTPTSVIRKWHETRAEAKMASSAEAKKESDLKDADWKATDNLSGSPKHTPVRDKQAPSIQTPTVTLTTATPPRSSASSEPGVGGDSTGVDGSTSKQDGGLSPMHKARELQGGEPGEHHRTPPRPPMLQEENQITIQKQQQPQRMQEQQPTASHSSPSRHPAKHVEHQQQHQANQQQPGSDHSFAVDGRSRGPPRQPTRPSSHSPIPPGVGGHRGVSPRPPFGPGGLPPRMNPNMMGSPAAAQAQAQAQAAALAQATLLRGALFQQASGMPPPMRGGAPFPPMQQQAQTLPNMPPPMASMQMLLSQMNALPGANPMAALVAAGMQQKQQQQQQQPSQHRPPHANQQQFNQQDMFKHMPEMSVPQHQSHHLQQQQHHQQQQHQQQSHRPQHHPQFVSPPQSHNHIDDSGIGMNGGGGGGGIGDARHSPVNQLAKWFGADVLSKPLPQMGPVLPQGQKVMSVEELERQQQVVG